MPPTMHPPAKAVLPPAAQEDWQRIQGRVEGVRQRHRAQFAALGLLLGAMVFGAAFLGFSLADILLKLSPSARVLWLALGLGGLAAAVFLATVRPWWRLAGLVQTAREVEGVYPQLEDQLSTALEYGGDAQRSAQLSSPELVGALVTQTQTRSAPFDLKRTVRWRRVAWAALAAFLVGGGVAAYAGWSPRLFRTTWQRFIRPTAALAAPTLTVIENLEPTGGQYPVEASVPVSLTLGGRQPNTATLLVRTGPGPEARWEERIMERDPDGVYRALLRRLLDTTTLKVRAGDTESDEYTLRVYREPQVDEFTVRLDYPKYAGKAAEVLPPGQGDVKALRGTQMTVQLKANTGLAAAEARFESARPPAAATVDGRAAQLSFALEKDDRYQLRIRDPQGHENVPPASYRLQALGDAPPYVTIRKPARDLMVHREQTVKVEIYATDDVGVLELGLFHSLGLDEKKSVVRKLDPENPVTSAEGKLTWELGPLGLKGGEVIAYYAYALDNDLVAGPKMAKSELHFLTVYDEDDYDQPQAAGAKPPPTPQAVKQLDKLIDVQKKLLQEAFALARAREAAAAKPPTEKEKADAARAAKAERDLHGKLAELTEAVKQEMERQETPPAEPKEGDGPEPPRPALGTKELQHMQTAAEKMQEAAGKLDETRPPDAVRPEVEALRHLSETRRLLLSDKEGDKRFKMAMNNQAKKNRRNQQQQQQEDQQNAREEMAELPPMLEREKQIERDLDKLEEPQPQPPPRAAQDAAEAQKKEEERRKLKRQVQDALDQMAKDAQERARNLETIASRNEELRNAADQTQSAAEKLKQAEQNARQDQNAQARDQAHQAARDLQDAHRGIRDALEKQFRQELANLQRDAQELTQKQEDLAQASHDLQAQQAQSQPNQPNPKTGEANPSPQNQPSPKTGEASPSPQNQPSPKTGEANPSPQNQPSPKTGEANPSPQNQPSPKTGEANPSPQNQPSPKAGEANPSPQNQGEPKGGEPAPGQPNQEAGKPDARSAALARKQGEVGEELKDLGERLGAAAAKASEKQHPSAPSLAEARAQAEAQAPAGQAAQAAAQALEQGQARQAEQDQRRAARAMEKVAQAVQEALQKTDAADLKALAEALHKAQDLAREQGDVNKDLAGKPDPAKLAPREEQVSTAAQDLSGTAEKLEALQRQGRGANAREQLERAAQHSREAAQALAGQDTAKARDPAGKAEQALQAAVNEMERAAGKTLEEQARQAQVLAKEARENQEHAAAGAKELPQPEAGQAFAPADAEKRDEATKHERNAARQARRLEQSLHGLEEMAQAANPAAAQAARDARETSQDAKLPQSMEDLAQGLERIGDPRRASRDPQPPAPTPREAAAQGEALAQTVKQIERRLEQFAAEANGDQLSKLKALEQDSRYAARQAQELARQAQSKPAEKPGDLPEKAAKLDKNLGKIEPRIQGLEPTAPERSQLRQAQEAVKEATTQVNRTQGQPAETAAATGGPAFDRAREHLDNVSAGLVERMERILKAREVRAEEDEVAPKEYRALVERYYRALSEDVEEQK